MTATTGRNGTAPPDVLDIFAGDLQPMQVWHSNAEEDVAKWRDGIVDGYSTGFRALDHYIRLVQGELTLIAGRTSMGKTAIGMQMAFKVAQTLEREGDAGCVAVFSAEMSGRALYHRLASVVSGVNIHKLRTGKGTSQDFSAFADAMEQIRTLPIWIDDGSAPTAEIMLRRMSELHQDIPVRMMLFDFLELGGERDKSEELRVSGIVRSLKAIAKTMHIPVLALSQMNREVEKRANKMPQLSDLRSSGMLEQIADQVLMVTRPEYYVERHMTVDGIPPEDLDGIAYIQVAKNRNGPAGLCKLAFVKECSRFADIKTVPLNP